MENTFAKGYEAKDGQHYNLICAFDVVEHFVEPAKSFALLFAKAPDVLLIGTETYKGEGPEWWYLSPEDGQHVFFYSEAAMRYLAKTYRYHYLRYKNIHLLCNFSLGLTGLAVRVLLSRRVRVALRMYLATRNAWRYLGQ